MKSLIDDKTDYELAQSLLAEIAKAKNEIACAQGDITKATSRLNFLIVLANNMLDRKKDQQNEA